MSRDASRLQEEVAEGLRMVFKQSGTDIVPCMLTGAYYAASATTTCHFKQKRDVTTQGVC